MGNHGDRRKFTRAYNENMNVNVWSLLHMEHMSKSLMGMLPIKCLYAK
jgi:hypothetical protein